MCKCIGVVKKQLGLVFSKIRMFFTALSYLRQLKEAPMNQRVHTLGEEAAVLVWSSATRSLFCGVNNPASPGWATDCAISLQLSGHPSVSARVRQVGRINSTAQPFYIWIPTGGTLWRRTPGHRRDGSTSYYFSTHHSKFVYPWIYYLLTPWATERFVCSKAPPHGREGVQTNKETERAAVFSHSANKAVNLHIFT